MNETLQAGQHPDADQLTAFLEHTLPAHEQQQTLAHLAVCPECRQIVALALPPGDPSANPEPAVRLGWFPRLHPAWLGVPALAAALILVTIFLRNGEKPLAKGSQPSQIADARKPEAPPVLGLTPQAQIRHQNRPVIGTPPPRVKMFQRQPAGVAGGILGGVASEPAPADSFRASSAIAGPIPTSAARFVSAVPAASLPSGLPILSMASRANQRIAIDADHQLYLSEDGGKTWKPVPATWKGQAVGVALTFGNRTAFLKMSAVPAPATGPALSGTVTDQTSGVIPEAIVGVTNSAAAFVRTVVTDHEGKFHLDTLLPGSYNIRVQATGFETESFAVDVLPAKQTVADITLRVASAAQSVSVQSAPIALDAARAVNHLENPWRFALTTDNGERWTSTDGKNWTKN